MDVAGSWRIHGWYIAVKQKMAVSAGSGKCVIKVTVLKPNDTRSDACLGVFSAEQLGQGTLLRVEHFVLVKVEWFAWY